MIVFLFVNPWQSNRLAKYVISAKTKKGTIRASAVVPFLFLRKCYTTVTFVAAGPFCPCSISNVTRSPSLRDLNPDALIPEWWTNTSGPFSCSMNPNPFWSLNHFTVPLAIVTISFQKKVVVPNFRLLPPWQMKFPPKKETGTSSKMHILVS